MAASLYAMVVLLLTCSLSLSSALSKTCCLSEEAGCVSSLSHTYSSTHHHILTYHIHTHMPTHTHPPYSRIYPHANTHIIQGTHWINITFGWGRLIIGLWGLTLGQHHTGLWQVGNCSMGTQTGPISTWLWLVDYSSMWTHWTNINWVVACWL